jgi:uncharacterized cupin superfamily protein
VPRVSIADPAFTYDPEDPEGYRAGLYRIGPLLGASGTGTSVYEVPPGQSICPYHYEYGEEEWLLVLDGRPSLRTPEGTERLEPLDVVFFPKGPDGAHKVTNDTDATIRVLMFSTVVNPSASAYPDSDKIGIWTGQGDNVMVRRSSHVEYYDGEPDQA